MKFRQIAATALLWLIAAMTHADDEIRVITLHHRNVEQLLPLLQPLIAGEGAVTGRDNQLIVRGDTQRIAQIQRVVDELDRAPRRLSITVMQTDKSNAELRSIGMNVGIHVGAEDVGVETQTRAYSTQDRDDNTLSQTIQAIEGAEAAITLARHLPRQDVRVGTGPRGSHVESTTTYQTLSSGFRVLPRLSGDVVTLTIAPQRARELSNRSSAIETSSADTVISGPLGEWLELGGVSHEVRSNDRQLLGSTSREGQREQRILIKVTAIP